MSMELRREMADEDLRQYLRSEHLLTIADAFAVADQAPRDERFYFCYVKNRNGMPVVVNFFYNRERMICPDDFWEIWNTPIGESTQKKGSICLQYAHLAE